MENSFKFRLLEEVRLQCRFATQALGGATETLQLNDAEKVCFYAHAFVRHAVDVGKLLWPEATEATERGKELREACGAPENAPNEFTAFRELADAFDEKLLVWYGNEEHRNAQPINLMPVGTLGGFPADDFHRSLDPETMQFTFEGVSGKNPSVSEAFPSVSGVFPNISGVCPCVSEVFSDVSKKGFKNA